MNRIKVCLSVFFIWGGSLLGIIACKPDSRMLFIPVHPIPDNDGEEASDNMVDSATYIYKTAGNIALKLDVFTPEIKNDPTKLLPVIMLFHGGGWRAGTRESFRWQCRYFAQHGFVSITADYRLLNPESKGIAHTKEICIWDAKSAIRWVRSHAKELHINPHEVILGGGSAGGHLATMAALDNTMNDPADDTTISTKGSALVLFNPAYNSHDNPGIEPFELVSQDVPPTIMFFGSNDDKWKPGGDSLYSLLKQHGVKSKMWIAKGQKHGFFNNEPWRLATCIKALSFLAKCGWMVNDIPEIHSWARLTQKQ